MNKQIKLYHGIAINAILASILCLSADTVTSRDGEMLKGKVISESETSIVFDTPFFGKVTIPRANIAELMIEKKPGSIELNDDSREPQSFQIRLQKIDAPFSQPDDETYDWIQLTSGEWLKGSIKAMYRNSLEFDSDELDMLDFDWEDINRIRTANKFSVRVDNTTTRIGKLAMKDENISIDDENPSIVDQFDLISIAPNELTEFDLWTAKISLTSNLRSGNSEERDFGISGVLQRRTSQRRIYLDFLSNYSELNGQTTSDDYRVNANLDSYLSRRIFIRPISFEFYKDPFQNIDKKYTLGASIGYIFLNNRKATWDATIGPAYQSTEFINVFEGEMKREEDPAIVLTSQFDTEITKRLDLVGSYKIQYANTTGGLTTHSLTKLEYELTKAIDFDISLVWDRIEDPVVNESGVIPGNDDIRITFGIGIDL